MDLLDLDFHDSEIPSIKWLGDLGEDLEISLKSPLARNRLKVKERCVKKIKFEYVTSLSIEVDFEGFFGFMSIYNFRLTELPKARWAVNFEFRGSPVGEIKFECNQI